MKRKMLLFVLIITLSCSNFAATGTAKELDSLAEIAAISKIEPLGFDISSANASNQIVEAGSLPSSYSSKDLGYTTTVRQQSANICWAYSSLAAMETMLIKSGISTSHFAPQHMNIWGTTESDGTGWQREDLINDGGYSYIPMGYLTSWSGPLLESEFPIDSDVSDYNAETSTSSYGVTGIKYIDRDTPIDTVKSYIMEYGAVVTNFNADTYNYMNADSEAFYCGDSTLSTSSLYGHSVALVGWDDNYSKENFSTSHSGDTPENNGAWLIKNSWGEYINKNGGYFWISYEDAWLFHSIFGPSFAICEYEALDSSKTIYQNEIYGATVQFPYLTDETHKPVDAITYINVFDFTDEYTKLDKVVFESTSYDADYTVYYIPVFNGKPTQEKGLWQQLYTGTIDYTGYICADFDDFDLPSGTAAIGITIDNTRTYNENKNNPDYEYVANSMGVCEWLAYKGGYYIKTQGQYGDSFIMWTQNEVTKFCDIMEFYEDSLNDTLGGTLVIKAIAFNPDLEPPATTEASVPTEATQTPSSDAPAESSATSPTPPTSSTSELPTITPTTTENTSASDVTTEPSESTSISTSSTSPSVTQTYIMGDVDYSGNISVKDATMIQKYLAKLVEFDEISTILADVNNSKSCTIADATLIQKNIAMIKTDSLVGNIVILYIA